MASADRFSMVIKDRQLKKLTNAWRDARSHGVPVNYLLTIHWERAGQETGSNEHPQDRHERFLDLLRRWLKQRGHELHTIWAVESTTHHADAPVIEGLHAHYLVALADIPARHFDALYEALGGWTGIAWNQEADLRDHAIAESFGGGGDASAIWQLKEPFGGTRGERKAFEYVTKAAARQCLECRGTGRTPTGLDCSYCGRTFATRQEGGQTITFAPIPKGKTVRGASLVQGKRTGMSQSLGQTAWRKATSHAQPVPRRLRQPDPLPSLA